MPNHTLFYVYVLRDPRPGKNLQPIYVGKGKGRRARTHWQKAAQHKNSMLRRVFAKIHEAGLQPLLEIIRNFDVEADAFRLEIELIAKYGRRNLKLGPLCNLTDGGEGASGSLANAEVWHKLHADPVFAEAHATRGREIHAARLNTPEGRAASAERLREIQARPEVKQATVERAVRRNKDPKFREAVSERMKKYCAEPEVKKAQSDWMKSLHADPIFVEAHSIRTSKRMHEQNANLEFQDRKAAGTAAYWADPENRARERERRKASWVKRREKASAVFPFKC